MIGKEEYRKYVQSGNSPQNLSKEFLLDVSNIHIIHYLIVYIQSNIYQELKNIEKEHLNQKYLNKWNQYQIQINQDIFNNLKHFKAIER